MKIIHQREKCIGCGSCAAVCPKCWTMGDDGKSALFNCQPNPKNNDCELETENIGCNQEAADSCPAQCIKIEK